MDFNETPQTVPTSEPVKETPVPVTTSGPESTNKFDEITNMILGRMGGIGETQNFKMLVYGDPGSTKSSFLGTIPNNLIYDLEQGLTSIKTAEKITGRKTAEGIQTIPYTSFQQAEALVDRLQSRIPQLEQFTTFSIDTISDLAKRGLAEVTEREWKRRPSSNRYVPETEHYTENNERIDRFVRSLKDLDRNLVLVAHARTIEPKGRPARTFPDFSENLANKLMAKMDIVGYMSMKNIDNKPTPVMRVISDGGIYAKTRFKIDAEIINPTYDSIYNAWQNSLKEN